MLKEIRSILSIPGFCTNKFASSLTCMCNPKTSTGGNFTVIHTRARNSKKSESPDSPVPSRDGTKPSSVGSHSENECPSRGPLSATFIFFTYVCFLWVTSLCGMAPTHRAHVLAMFLRARSQGALGSKQVCQVRRVCQVNFLQAPVSAGDPECDVSAPATSVRSDVFQQKHA